MSEPAKKKGGWLKAMLVGLLGLGGGAAGTYATAVVERVARPTKPVANFAVSADGLTVTCQNHASGESGWWDFGDGTPLEPFAPNQPAVAHAYAKPGGYTVKLTVRNFMADENERSVPVEVRPGAQDASAPAVGTIRVVPVSPASVAPATFRVSADVRNADHCVWDLGDGRVEVTNAAGASDHLVTFDKAGTHPISLIAHNSRSAARQSTAVQVQPLRDGQTVAVLTVTDTGSRVERVAVPETVAIPVPSGKAPAPGFEKTVPARSGFTIADAALGTNAVAGVKNLRATITPDRRAVKVTGEWTDPKAAARTAGGTDVMVPLKVTEERVAPTPAAVTVVTGTFAGWAGIARLDLPLPPAPAGLSGVQRRFQLEIREGLPNGQSRVLERAPVDSRGSLAFPWAWTQNMAGGGIHYTAKLDGDRVSMTYHHLMK